MSTADAMRGDAAPNERTSKPSSASSVPSAAWLLRAAAVAASAAGLVGVIVAPGVRGNASESVVVGLDWASGALAVFLLFLLLSLAVWGAIELLRAPQAGIATRAALLFGGALVVAVSSYGLRDRVPPFFAGVITVGAVVTAIASAYAAAGAPHTRLSAALLFVLAFAAISRLGAWSLALHAGDTASVRLFSMSRGLATSGVLFEAAGQLLAVVWLSTRSRGGGPGQLGSTLALAGALALTWGVARGVHSDASLWQSVLHTALADAPGIPPPYGLDALATFLVPASLLLALAIAVQPRHGGAILAAMALALVSRGAFDAPLRALCAVVAAFWTVLARGDERAMWQTLLRERQALIEEAGGNTRVPARGRGAGLPLEGARGVPVAAILSPAENASDKSTPTPSAGPALPDPSADPALLAPSAGAADETLGGASPKDRSRPDAEP